jgi:hypothetical protein
MLMRQVVWLKQTYFALLLLTAGDCLAGVEGESGQNPFHKSYVRLELTRNYPEAWTQLSLRPGSIQTNLSYLHIVNSEWMMALGGGLRTLDRVNNEAIQAPSRTLAIFAFNHESARVFRISHPYYGSLGLKVSYLLPSRSGKLPPLRDPIYPAEIGASIFAQLIRMIGQGTMINLRVERWRGVNSSKLAGLEIACGIAVTTD